MNERIEKIKQFATARDNKANEELRLKKESIANLKSKIISMKEEIKEIIEIGNACVANGIKLSPGPMTHGTYENKCFMADGVTHILGFKYPNAREKIIKIGFSGGGACSYEYFYVDAEGNCDFKPNGRDHVESELYIIRAFVNKFETFKTAFYDYVDKIIN